MIKTKIFKEGFYGEKRLDDKINKFLEENDVEIIDIKMSRDSQNLCTILLIYKEIEQIEVIK